MQNVDYFEDIEVGNELVHKTTYTVSAKEIKYHANKYDPMPFHLSEKEAKKWGHPTISAPGTLTEAIVVWLLSHNVKPFAAIALAGKENLLLPTPVYAGDALSLTTKVLGKRPSKTKPDRGIIRFQVTSYNQAKQVVYDAVHTVIVFRKPPQKFKE